MEQKDIERVTPLIRALYMHQPVMMHPDWECFNDNRPTMVEAHHFEDSQKKRWDKGYLLLRQLSSITDDEAVQVALIMGLTSGDFTIERTDEDGQPLLCLNAEEESQCLSIFFQGDIYFYDLDTMDAVPGLNYSHAYSYLHQLGFALPYYDSITNTTLTPERMQEYGIIKLKERL